MIELDLAAPKAVRGEFDDERRTWGIITVVNLVFVLMVPRYEREAP